MDYYARPRWTSILFCCMESLNISIDSNPQDSVPGIFCFLLVSCHNIEVDPMLNLRLLIETGKIYSGDTDRSNYLLSPINGPLHGLGKITLFVGTHELFLADARRFRALAKREKVEINYFEYPKMNHVFPVLPIPEADLAMKQMIDIIKGRKTRKEQ